MAWWGEKYIFRPVKDFLKGSEQVQQGKIEGETRIAFVDEQGTEYIQRGSDLKILDPLTGLWLRQEAFKYFALPGIMAQENPQLFEETMQSVEEVKKAARESKKAFDDFIDKNDSEEIEKKDYSQYLVIGACGLILYWTAK